MAETTSKGRQCILVVEDEPLIRLVAAETLREAGYHTIEANSADEAMALLPQGGITLILTDIDMPGSLDGLDLAWAANGYNPRVPVVLMSGRLLPRPSEMPVQVRFLAKPFRDETLLHLVAEALR